MATVICQKWEESENEPGWGVTVRDDGFSIHLTEADRIAFINQYWKALKAENGNKVPASYIRPNGEPYMVNLRSSSKVYQKLLKTQVGLYQSEKAPEGYRKVS